MRRTSTMTSLRRRKPGYVGSVVAGPLGRSTTVASAGPLSASEWGTYDQSGNVSEWTDTILSERRSLRGGSYRSGAAALRRTANSSENGDEEDDEIGFRVAAVVGGEHVGSPFE